MTRIEALEKKLRFARWEVRHLQMRLTVAKRLATWLEKELEAEESGVKDDSKT